MSFYTCSFSLNRVCYIQSRYYAIPGSSIPSHLDWEGCVIQPCPSLLHYTCSSSRSRIRYIRHWYFVLARRAIPFHLARTGCAIYRVLCAILYLYILYTCCLFCISCCDIPSPLFALAGCTVYATLSHRIVQCQPFYSKQVVLSNVPSLYCSLFYHLSCSSPSKLYRAHCSVLACCTIPSLPAWAGCTVHSTVPASCSIPAVLVWAGWTIHGILP